MQLPKNRWQAFAAHFAISLLIFFALLAIILFLWYPGALFNGAGGWQGIRIVVGVDLVLGPLLTLIVYNLTTKPRRLLYRDLFVVGCVQLSCLVAGVGIVYGERPVAVIYSIDKFYALKKSDFVANGKKPQELGLHPMTPAVFQVELGAGSREEAELLSKINQLVGKNVLFRTDLYQPLPRTMPETEHVFRFTPLPRHPAHPEHCLTAELVSAYAEGLVCFDPTTQHFEKFLAK